jgi:uncharacterized protein YjdB
MIAAATITCAEHSVSGVPIGKLATLGLAPVFGSPPEGGPDIDVAKIRGVLRSLNSTDSIVAEALVEGDSAILEFANVTVSGDSTAYNLGVEAFDADNALVFEGSQVVRVKPGENAPAAPSLEYAAADENVDAIEIKDPSGPVSFVQLDWAGAVLGDLTCLNRAPKTPAVTEVPLHVRGTAGGSVVNDVRVGWTSRDENVVSVDQTGLVRARCSNKSTWVVARTFLNAVDSVEINVIAPAFSLLMSPDSTTLERGATKQLTAVVVDENNNETAAQGVTYSSSDLTRATVSTSGVVTALRNGQVFITASSGNRTTVGVVQVVRPKAVLVKVIPLQDTLAYGQVSQYFARAFDASGRVIGDAEGFQWSSSNTAVATVSTNGVVTAKNVTGNADIAASLDGKTGSSALRVEATVPGGTINGIVKNGSTDGPLSGATITAAAGCSATTITDGSYSLVSCVRAGDDMTFAASGYVPVTFYDAPAFPGRSIQVHPVPLSPDVGGQGEMRSKVVNALSNAGVSGLTIKAYAGLHAAPSPRRPSPPVVATTTTASDGTFSLFAPPGAYTLVASGTGYSEGFGVGTSVSSATKFTPAIILPPVIPGGGLFVLVTWADCSINTAASCDLDAHLTGPMSATDATRFHVFSGNKSFVDLDTIAALDVDRSGAGTRPELIGLRTSATPGLYRFYVHDVSNTANSTSVALSTLSNARVDVFQDNRVIATFFPPNNQAGNLWEVFHYDGARIFPIGTLFFSGSPTSPP